MGVGSPYSRCLGLIWRRYRGYMREARSLERVARSDVSDDIKRGNERRATLLRWSAGGMIGLGREIAGRRWDAWA